MLGERVAEKYSLRRLLGSGAMGAVYECEHLDIGKRLAIKLIHPEYCESQEAVARFRREARAASAVESDYIVQIFDFGRDPRLGLYMVIEYLEGEDLEARLARERWIGERETVSIGVQIGRGLAKAHAAGIVHRDLKPANVFLTRDDDGFAHVKLLDFGISKFEPAGGSPSGLAEPTLTANGMTLGTPEYMSPEQIQGLPIDGRTDVWSMAAVLYEMLAGECPVQEAGGPLAVMQRILKEGIPPLRQRASWVSDEMCAVIDAALARDRERRIPDATTFVARLLEIVPDAGVRSSITQITKATDISELIGPDSEAAPSTTSDPKVAVMAAMAAVSPLADTAQTLRPAPGEEEPPSSRGEAVAIFERGVNMPPELEALRRKRRT